MDCAAAGHTPVAARFPRLCAAQTGIPNNGSLSLGVESWIPGGRSLLLRLVQAATSLERPNAGRSP